MKEGEIHKASHFAEKDFYMKLVNRLKIAAEVLIGLWGAFMLYRQVDEMIGGDFNLFSLAIPLISLFIFLIFYGFLMWGAWKIP
jgi:hypothetical protein